MFVSREDFDPVEPEEGWDVTIVDRLPDVGEHWDDASEAFVTDSGVVADMCVPAGHIDRMHALKQLEASVILSGYELTHGVLAREAVALGIVLVDLAQSVLDQCEEDIAIEIARRVEKSI